MADFAKESGHWYTQSGEPAYTIIGRNGKLRNTTLRDAKKEGLVPSVTTILRLIAKPGLEIWKQKQIALAALTLPRNEGESLDDFLVRVMRDAQEEAKQAADKGTAIHAQIEAYYQGRPMTAYQDFVAAAVKEINAHFPNEQWLPEKSFASPLFYGGKVDLHSTNVVIDIKTKSGISDAKAYREQGMQLAAYANGLGIPGAKLANLFVDRDKPEAKLIIHDQENTYWDEFVLLLKAWQLEKGYSVPPGEGK